MRLIRKPQPLTSKCLRYRLGLTIKSKVGLEAVGELAFHSHLIHSSWWHAQHLEWIGDLIVYFLFIMYPKGWCLCRTLAPGHFRIVPDLSTLVLRVDVSPWLIKVFLDMFSQPISVHAHVSVALSSPAKARFPGPGKWMLPECSHG